MVKLELKSEKSLTAGNSDVPISQEARRSFEKANENRDYSIYTGAMDAALEAKARSIFPHFGNIKEGSVVVDAGSGTGQMAELAAQEFHGAQVFALDISHELQERAEDGRALSSLVFGDATEQNFPGGSVDVKYYSTSGHEIESFGGAGSIQTAVKNTFHELAPGGRIVIRDFSKPSRKEPVYMRILSKVGIDDVSDGIQEENIDYNLLSASALFHRFHEEFQGGGAFEFEKVNINGGEYIKIDPEWAHEFYLRKDYTGNWRQEIKEKYTYWSAEDAQRILEEEGYVNVQVIPDPNEYIISNRLKGKIDLQEMREGKLKKIDFPATHMIIVGEKPIAVPSPEDQSMIADRQEMPVIDYKKIFSTMKIDGEGKVVKIDDKEYLLSGKPIIGTKKMVFQLEGSPKRVLKIVRSDTHNDHNAFKTMYQTIERQSVLQGMNTPHLKIIERDPGNPPWRYVIQEALPEGSVSAAELIESGEISEEDVKQMAEIINRYEKGKEWQLDTNPFGWFRVTREDGSTQMVYVSSKVYRYDERWEFKKIGLLQWIDPHYVQNSQFFCAAIPRARDYEKMKEKWQEKGDQVIGWWKKYLDPSLQPEIFDQG
jgi:ubiquinone/menaquinone biosynthesis C-methylase UbiE